MNCFVNLVCCFEKCILLEVFISLTCFLMTVSCIICAVVERSLEHENCVYKKKHEVQQV